MKSVLGCPDCCNLEHRYQCKKYYTDYNEFICKKQNKKIIIGYFNGDNNCPEFKWDIIKAIKHILREVFYCKIYLNLHLKYEIWKIHRDFNRNAILSAYGVKERGTIKGTIPRKYKGSIEEIKRFEDNYINYLKTHKTKVRDDYTMKGYIEITLYEKYLKEDGINLDKIPFEWDIQSKRIIKEMNKKS